MDKELRVLLTYKYSYLTKFTENQKRLLKEYRPPVGYFASGGTTIFLRQLPGDYNIVSYFLFSGTSRLIPKTDFVEVMRFTPSHYTRNSSTPSATDTTFISWDEFYSHFKKNISALPDFEPGFPVFLCRAEWGVKKALETLSYNQDSAQNHGESFSISRFKKILKAGY